MVPAREGSAGSRGGRGLPYLLLLLLAFACGSRELLPEAGPEERFARADGYLAEGKEMRALEAYRALSRLYLGTEWEERAHLGVARSYRAMEDFPAAEQEYESFSRRFPRSNYADDALFEIALCYAEQRKDPDLDPEMNQKALNQLNDFIARYPESELVPRAREEVLEARTHAARKALENGLTYAKLRRYSAARFYLKIVADEYPETEVAPEALCEIGRTHLREGSEKEALGALEALRSRYPESGWTRELERELGARKRGEGEKR
jgi:outer membrane protein assembly factor BamD